jgi:hypothetical protein
MYSTKKWDVKAQLRMNNATERNLKRADSETAHVYLKSP